MIEIKYNVGNYIRSGHGLYKVALVSLDGVEALIKNNSDEIFAASSIIFEPIPITEEWLVRLGFDKMHGCFNYDRSKELGHHFGDFALSIYDTTQIKIWRGDRYCGVVHCEFVHQLQNLFYALSGGVELTIKETQTASTQ